MSKTYRRTHKGRKTDWLPEIYSVNSERKRLSSKETELFDPYRCDYIEPKEAEWIKANPHRCDDVNDWFGARNIRKGHCNCEWCRNVKKKHQLKKQAVKEMMNAKKGIYYD